MSKLQIISTSFDRYTLYNLEIQTALCKCLDQITQIENFSDSDYQNENIDFKLRN